MKITQLNCQIHNAVIVIEYSVLDGRLVCTEDISIKGWRIDRRIICYGGKWKYDPNSYLEFIISDPIGITKIFKLYVNANNCMINIKSRAYFYDNGWNGIIKDFIENCTLWNCCNWNDALTPKYEVTGIIK